MILKNTRYVFVTGGVVSSLGKGILAASLGKLLQFKGFSVTIAKLDPYLNVDPGTMNPYEHGECFVTYDGGETDLDLGHYERFLNKPIGKANSVTSGSVYSEVIINEREGKYIGKTVQVIPHITNEIRRRIEAVSGENDFVIVEIGGTVGDIESLPYLETIRQMRWDLGTDRTCFVHLSMVPYMSTSNELKTKPTQHSVKALQGYGIQPDVLVLRTEHVIPEDVKTKVGLFCNVRKSKVVQAMNVDSVYSIPKAMLEEGLDVSVLESLGINNNEVKDKTFFEYESYLKKVNDQYESVNITLVGKYTSQPDSYKSIIEALRHAGVKNSCKINITLKDASLYDGWSDIDMVGEFDDQHAIIVCPGFGSRDVDGKIASIGEARCGHIPFLGICFGMQLAVVEFARNVAGMKDAHSTEIQQDTAYPVIDILKEQAFVKNIGGTLRLGEYPCEVKKDTILYDAYIDSHPNETEVILIRERHRHRWEFNTEYENTLAHYGLIISGKCHWNDNKIVLNEAIELPKKMHPWFVGVQFHPEYASTPENPHPIFVSLVSAAIDRKRILKNI
jgi:CTP synthase